ncbi:hypothetical protein A2686_02570 [Candidatus Woesebacteria bacterium RIFCSPHIGHO2_01_FULL_38_10]|uniref:Type II secretion system protein GspF domain-containing protein n=1 Tax=Candidatus Woesebacteria bacterium RIFCSPLOWO2_01_FULL_39_10b TaxID=1802517 RepID=A0A1F8B8T4_9BACT|nr:MAG: hypothetical protein A2686_02570 [Candidatus Woesebacteria bacterium RIFCSPHIGHO2_01_FULL_38_10]OGM60452.1 MAG: hypothetical protein A2892_00260 [Candidatus Woesebacteria bacterium RIFCSPLOWO2_01_FULL_39_10b]
MKLYKYKAKDEKGNFVIGEVEAKSQEHAARLVRQRGNIVISISEKRELSFIFLKNLTQRVSGGEVARFTRQISTMVTAGLPLTETLSILHTQARGSMQKIISAILSRVGEGESLSSAMSMHPKVFSKTYVALIKSGEAGGVMDEVLEKLAENIEKQQEYSGKVKSAMVYPLIILLGMVGVVIIMFIFVVPRLTTLYSQFEAELPLSTKIVIGISEFLVNFWPIVIIGFTILVWGFNVYRSNLSGRKKIDSLVFQIPFVGELQKQIILADFTRTLSLMTESGVSVLESLSISSEVINNSLISDALSDMTKMVEKGFPLAFAFSRHPEAFPITLAQMVAVGEETGKMDEVLAKASHIFEIESDQKVKVLTSAMEPLILILLGVGVAFLIISIIMPIYKLTTEI